MWTYQYDSKQPDGHLIVVLKCDRCGEFTSVRKSAYKNNKKIKPCFCSAFDYLSGAITNGWTYIKRDVSATEKQSIIVKCIYCGKEQSTGVQGFKNKKTNPCTCQAHRNMIGRRFGRWTVTAPDRLDYQSKWYYHCRCDCGSMKSIAGYSLSRGDSTSCGCYAKEQTKERSTTHGESHLHVFRCWQAMLCRVKNCKAYTHVSVCPEWSDKDTGYLAFRDYFGYIPEGLTVERIDNSKGYCPSNCTLATQQEQAQHTSRNVLNPELVREIRKAHEEYGLTYTQLSRKYNINSLTISRAIRKITWSNIE